MNGRSLGPVLILAGVSLALFSTTDSWLGILLGYVFLGLALIWLAVS